MKVLVVGTGGALGGSGITTMADQMVRTLAEMGHEPTRLVAGDRLRRRPNRLNLENVLAVLTEAVALARAARSSRVDVVWLHTFGVPTLPAIRTLAQTLAVRVVRRSIIVEFHAFALADQVASAGRLQRSALRMIGRMSERVVVLQDADAQALRHLVVHGRVAVLPNWVDVSSDPPPLPPGPPYTAVFVGGLVERKGVPQLLQAMRLLEDVPIRLRLVGGAGDEGESSAATVRASVADLGPAGLVTFVGELDRVAVRAEIAAAHLLVLPSRAEGMPLAMVEALAEGRSVVVSDAGNMARVVRAHNCGIVLSSVDPDAIAAAIAELLQDPDQLAAMGRRAHAAAATEFSAQAVSSRLRRILQESGAGP